MFGENLTVEGIPAENELGIGDGVRIGSAELIVTQPRLPCFKIGVRFGEPRMVKRFLDAGRTGFYLRIAHEGVVAAGDALELATTSTARAACSRSTPSPRTGGRSLQSWLSQRPGSRGRRRRRGFSTFFPWSSTRRSRSSCGTTSLAG